MPNNQEFDILIFGGTLLTLILLVSIFLFVILYHKAQLKLSLSKKTYEQALLKSAVEIQEQTLTQIGRELHDNIGQLASLTKIHLTQSALSDKHLKESEVVLDLMITEIKALSTSLKNTKYDVIGFEGMLQNEFNRLAKQNKVVFTLNKTGNLEVVPKEKGVVLYRIIQELIHNILKHSEAQKAEVNIAAQANLLTLKVMDNGKGFSLNKAKTAMGNGLQNLVERSSIIGGKLELNSEPGKGTSATLTLPF